jgi:trimeric autotransporter adhesin
MNKSQLFTLSGALLASTALAGTANAATVGRIGTNVLTPFAANTITVANTLFSGTAATANAIQFVGSGAATPIAISFTNNLSTAAVYNLTINAVGATMNNTNFGHSILARNAASPATFVGTHIGGCTSVTALVDKILLSACVLTSASISASLGNTAAIGSFSSGVILSGIIFANASGLATAGGAITLSGTVNDNANPAVVLENISSGTVLASAAPVVTTVTPGASAVTDPTTTPTAFKSFSSPNSGQLSITLATVTITGAANVFGTNLTTVIDPDGAIGAAGAAATSVTITVTSAALTDDATATATLINAATTVVLTPAALTSGSGAFSVAGANFSGANSVQTVSVQFDGTHAINAAAAGTVAVAYGTSVATGHVVAPAAGSGTTSAITSGGFQTEFNTAFATGNDFASFIRVHNNGGAAGAVTFTVLNDADGTSLGTYTTASIAVGQTLQVDMPTIEAAAGITTPSGTYTLQLTGPIVAYAQHVLFNATTGQFTDLSGFRNGAGTNNP